ncbi:MAG: hypothetical protein PUB19_05615 [Lachnospiraceae bacterium]|nr:hypothetical protein [Lachnospiraceae bacterium]
MIELLVEIIKFPLKLLYYLVGGFLFLIGSIFVHGEHKTGEKISAGLIAGLSFAVAAVYYYFNGGDAKGLLIAGAIFAVLIMLLLINIWIIKQSRK